ncbi:MAG: hypothetical protein GY906_23740 [bacterium]|nr:hypothetical protein [bacterium]
MPEENETDIGKEIDDAINSMESEGQKEEAGDESTGEQTQTQETDGGSAETKDEGGDAEGGSKRGDQDGGDSERGSEGEEDEGGEQGLDSGLLARAVSMGIDLTDAKAFTDDGTLGDFLDKVDANVASQVADEQKVAEEGKAPKEKGEDLLANLPKLDPEVYGEEAIETFGKLIEKIKDQDKQLGEFRSEQNQTTRSVADANAKAVEDFFDDSVAKLGKDFKNALGEGGVSSLARGSSQYAKREAIAQEMTIRLRGFQAQGLTPPPREEVFSDAARFVLRDEYAAIEKQKLSDELGSRSEQHLQRGSSKKGGSKSTAEQETVDLLAEKFSI